MALLATQHPPPELDGVPSTIALILNPTEASAFVPELHLASPRIVNGLATAIVKDVIALSSVDDVLVVVPSDVSPPTRATAPPPPAAAAAAAV